MSKAWMALFVALACLLAPIQAYALSEEDKITMLIESVRDTPEGTHFIRNGKAHDVADAVSHLNLKYSKAKSRVKTAEEFIQRIASGSSVSGEEYLMRYPDGMTVTAAVFFAERLRGLEGER